MPVAGIPGEVLGFMAAAVPAAGAWFATRSTFTSRIMQHVETRCADLEREVKDCRDRDKLTGIRIAILEASIRMALPELARLDPRNLILKQAVTALNALPETTDEWQRMLDEIDRKTPGLSFDGKQWSDQQPGGG